LKNQNSQNNQNQNIFQNPVYSIEAKHNKIHKHNNSDNENSKNEKFCYICNRNRHTTKKCNLNPKNPLNYYHKFYVEYLQKYESQNKNKNKIIKICKSFSKELYIIFNFFLLLRI